MAGHANFSVVAAIAGTAWLSGCSAQPAAEAQPPLVRTVIVGPDSTGAAGDAGGSAYTGTIHARVESALGFRVPGKIADRLVNAGERVRAGQPLFRLDARDLGLAASAALGRVRAAEADAARTTADEARLRPLVATGAVSASAYDGAKAARDAAAASLASARAGAANAANERGYATLFADADGVVTEVLAEPGQVVAAGTPVLRFARAGAREALVAVPETAVTQLPRAAQAQVYGAPTQLSATLREVAGAADPLTRTFAARYVLAGRADAIPLGATVTIRVQGAPAEAVRVPLGAMVDLGRGAGVWIVGTDAKVRFRPAQPLRLTEEEALLPAALLPPGTRIVALGGHLLKEGQKVRLADQQGTRP
ncbi:MAG: efflux RND transporter periplasmic adaptor subunit [Novosphingobium sp.]